MSEAPDPSPERRWTFLEEDAQPRLPGGPSLWAFGGLGLVTALAPYVPQLAFFAWIDLPVTLLLFLACAWIALADRTIGRLGMLGFLLGLAGVITSVLHLLTDRQHPWAP